MGCEGIQFLEIRDALDELPRLGGVNRNSTDACLYGKLNIATVCGLTRNLVIVIV